jgi:hypothetical protein
VLTVVLSVLGVAGLLLVFVAGFFGDDRRSNAGPILLWVYFWLVIPFLSAIVGNIYRWINPWRAVADAADLGNNERSDLLPTWGVWPATVAFVAFTWLELVDPDSGEPLRIAVAAAVYSVYVLGLALWAGRATAMTLGEAFTTYNGMISRIAPFEWTPDRGLAWRGWLRALPATTMLPGLTVFVVAMIGTVTYDGMSASTWWEDVAGDLAGERWFATLALVGTVAVIGAAYWLASWAAARLSEMDETTATQVARSFVHTLVPIALAYAVAHYFTLIIFEGQLIINALSDPLGLGWDLFGTADRRISFWLSPTAIWYVQLVAILGGHLLGVILAHDRALAVFPKETAVRTQYAMLALMVVLTGLGLALLAAS